MSLETPSGHATIVLACDVFGISRAAYYAARKGASGAAPARRRSIEKVPRWTPAETLQPRIREIVAAHPAWGVRKVWAMLHRDGYCVGHRRVWALMKSMGLTLAPDAGRAERRAYGKVVVADSNRRWASDLTTVWTKENGVVAIVPVIDCGDRVALALDVSKAQDAPAILAPITRALLAEFGHPSAVPPGLELRTDHGSQYTGADCDDLCRAWHVDHTLAPVGRPTGNSVVERFIRTLKEEVIWLRDWTSIDELRRALADWLLVYNGIRPHQALVWKTPDERRAELRARTANAVA